MTFLLFPFSPLHDWFCFLAWYVSCFPFSLSFILLHFWAWHLSYLPFLTLYILLFHFYALQLSRSLQTYITSCFPLRYSYCLYMTCLIFFLHKFTQLHLVPVHGISLLLASLFYSCSTTKLYIICIFPTHWYVCFYFICVHDITLSLYQTVKLTSLSHYCHVQLFCVDAILSFSLSTFSVLHVFTSPIFWIPYFFYFILAHGILLFWIILIVQYFYFTFLYSLSLSSDYICFLSFLCISVSSLTFQIFLSVYYHRHYCPWHSLSFFFLILHVLLFHFFEEQHYFFVILPYFSVFTSDKSTFCMCHFSCSSLYIISFLYTMFLSTSILFQNCLFRLALCVL